MTVIGPGDVSWVTQPLFLSPLFLPYRFSSSSLADKMGRVREAISYLSSRYSPLPLMKDSLIREQIFSRFLHEKNSSGELFVEFIIRKFNALLFVCTRLRTDGWPNFCPFALHEMCIANSVRVRGWWANQKSGIRPQPIKTAQRSANHRRCTNFENISNLKRRNDQK